MYASCTCHPLKTLQYALVSVRAYMYALLRFAEVWIDYIHSVVTTCKPYPLSHTHTHTHTHTRLALIICPLCSAFAAVTCMLQRVMPVHM